MPAASGVCCAQCLGSLAEHDAHLARGHPPLAGEPICEALPLHQLHDDVGSRAIPHAKVEDLDYVRAAKPRRDARFRLEALDHRRVFFGEPAVQELHRHPRVQHQVVGKPHFTHAAATEQRHQTHLLGDEHARRELG